MKIGADGVISVAANVIPKQIKELSDLCLDGQYSAALDKNQSFDFYLGQQSIAHLDINHLILLFA